MPLTIKLCVYCIRFVTFFSHSTRPKKKPSGCVTKALKVMRLWQAIKQRDVTDILPPNSRFKRWKRIKQYVAGFEKE